MTATTPSAEGGARQPEVPVESVQPVSLLANISPDRCVVCSAEMTSDQRYCVECGIRRGAARFKAPRATPKREVAGPSGSSAVAARVPAAVTRWLAVLAVLVALGVGVLIGGSGNSTVVKVVGGGSSASLGSSRSSTGKSSTSKSGGADAIGSKCSKGTPGCKNGKLTGNFFGS